MFGNRLLFLTALSMALGPRASGSAVPGRELVLSVLPSDDCVAKAVTVGAKGVALALTADVAVAVRHARECRLDVWIEVQYPWTTLPDLPKEATGLALMFPSPQGEDAPTVDFEALMAIKEKGDALGEALRQTKKRLGASQKLAICAPYSEIRPETAKRTYVPVEDLIRDGTVDVVCLSGTERYNFHRLRLLRDVPLRAGTFVDGAAIEEKARAGMLSRAVLGAIQNDTCECLWVHNLPIEMVGRVITHTMESCEREKAQREALAKAIEEGRLIVDQGVPAKSRNNQATVHGVAQSFVPSEDGACPLIQLYAALRRCRGPLPPALKVEIRLDDRGKPGKEALAKSEIPAAELGHEPTYRWGSANFEPAVPFAKGAKYWLYLPDASHPEGSYVWGIASNGATERGNAWSRRYDYTKHTWVFRVYLNKEPVR